MKALKVQIYNSQNPEDRHNRYVELFMLMNSEWINFSTRRVPYHVVNLDIGDWALKATNAFGYDFDIPVSVIMKD